MLNDVNESHSKISINQFISSFPTSSLQSVQLATLEGLAANKHVVAGLIMSRGLWMQRQETPIVVNSSKSGGGYDWKDFGGENGEPLWLANRRTAIQCQEE